MAKDGRKAKGQRGRGKGKGKGWATGLCPNQVTVAVQKQELLPGSGKSGANKGCGKVMSQVSQKGRCPNAGG